MAPDESRKVSGGLSYYSLVPGGGGQSSVTLMNRGTGVCGDECIKSFFRSHGRKTQKKETSITCAATRGWRIDLHTRSLLMQ